MVAAKPPEFKDLQKANIVIAGKYTDLLRVMREIEALCDKERERGDAGAELARKIQGAIRGLPGKATG